MSGPWRVVDLLSFDGTVRAGKGHLHVEGKGSVAMSDTRAVLAGPACTLHASVFDRAVEYGVPILHCDWKGVPISATYSWSGTYRVATRHRAQATMSIPRQKQGWQRIVRAKIQNQVAALKNVGAPEANTLRELVARVRSGDPTNVEAQAARVYWPALTADINFRRAPRTGSGINGALDYGYAVVRAVCLRAIVAAGLWPSLGIWHRSRDNPFALVDDVIEPFRPAVDLAVMRILKPVKELDKETKAAIVAALEQSFDASGHTLGTCIDHFGQHLALYVEREVSRLDPPLLVVDEPS